VEEAKEGGGEEEAWASVVDGGALGWLGTSVGGSPIEDADGAARGGDVVSDALAKASVAPPGDAFFDDAADGDDPEAPAGAAKLGDAAEAVRDDPLDDG
jgi:hypothetical protein